MGHLYTANQVLGRTQTIGCTAVEITQRCNLDCTLCYLSENSESVKDIPIEVVFHRLDEIVKNYGEGTHVQITGGEPTLRKHSELIEIVKYARTIGLHSALFTNGIAASRKLLKQLATVGLSDIAFHVDTTQQRHDFNSEQSLNSIRLEYIKRAQGLGLMVIFNTTIHGGNIGDIPMLIDFFVSHSDVVGFASFQLQAKIGRGIWGSRENVVSKNNVRMLIESAAGKRLPWDLIHIGHKECNSYMPLLAVGKSLHPIVYDKELIEVYLQDFSHVGVDRHNSIYKIISAYSKALLFKPNWWLRSLKYLFRIFWSIRKNLIQSRGKINKLSLFIHDFMDANSLNQERIDACSFMVMTNKGPVSMCAHNSRRDEYILTPVTVTQQDGSVIEFQPLSK
jgi:uncharacterized radical SAM superfamily Fe-S cluster-containing enzyme